MIGILESRVCGVSLSHLAETSMMWTALDEHGSLLHMSPAFAKLLLGSSERASEVVGANLASILGERYGGERLRFAQRCISNRQCVVSRSVMRGVQYVSHFHPAERRDEPHAPVVVVFHEAIEGPIDAERFEGGEYVEAVHNNYGRLAALSRREIEVAAMLARGLDAKQIANLLSRSLETVCSHKKSLFNKLGVDSQLQAAIIIRRAGLTERDVPRVAVQQRAGIEV